MKTGAAITALYYKKLSARLQFDFRRNHGTEAVSQEFLAVTAKGRSESHVEKFRKTREGPLWAGGTLESGGVCFFPNDLFSSDPNMLRHLSDGS